MLQEAIRHEAWFHVYEVENQKKTIEQYDV